VGLRSEIVSTEGPRPSLSDQPASVLAGVDGCRGGWIAVLDNVGRLESRVFCDWSRLMVELQRATLIGVDIPIGLPGKGSRQCDLQARRRLAQPRGSSVFPAPVRGVLKDGLSYGDASNLHRNIDGRGLNRQAYALMPKIQEVDGYLREDLARQRRVIEIHPEVSFAVWNGGRAMACRKSNPAGQSERERLIDKEWPDQRERLWSSVRGAGCARDDLNDAFAALWTVRRVVRGEFETLAPAAELDDVGLRMEITV
jgi:predicted RNase H-like nuclease